MRRYVSRVALGCAVFTATLCVGHGMVEAQDKRVVARVAQFGRVSEADAARIVGQLNRGLADNANRGGVKYDRVRERVGRTMWNNPGRTKAEYKERLDQVFARLRAGADPQVVQALFTSEPASAMNCVTDFPLTMSACDALIAASTGQRAALAYVPPDNGSALVTELVNSGAPKKTAQDSVRALSDLMLGVPRNVLNDPRGEDIAKLMAACPGALSSRESQIRAFHMGPTVGMARCIAGELAKRGSTAAFATQLILLVDKPEAGAFLAWGAPSVMSVVLASSAGGVSVENVLKTARAHYQAGRFAQAAAVYGQAVRMEPTSSRALAGLGSARLRLNDAAGAVTALNAALRSNPKNANLYTLLGQAFAAAGSVDNAMAAYRRALQADPKHAYAKAALTELQTAKGIAQAKVLRDKGRGHYIAKQYKIAANVFDKATHEDPTNAAGFAGLGASRFAMGDVTGSIDAYRKAISLHPDNASHWTQLAAALSSSGDKSAATESLKRALSIDPRNAQARAGLKQLSQPSKAVAKSSEENDSLMDSLLVDPLLKAQDEEAAKRSAAATAAAAAATAESIEGEGSPVTPAAATPTTAVAAVPTPAPAPAPASTPVPVVATAVPAAPTPASPAKALSNSDIDADLLGTPAAGSAPAGDDVIAEITSSAKLSETPSREGVVQALKPLLPGIAACAPGFHGPVVMTYTVDGPSGAVTAAALKSPPTALNAAQQACMVGVAKGADFPRFAKTGFSVSYPYPL